MDIATVLGLAAGIIMVMLTIVLGGEVWGFLNLPSLILVCGGTIAATLINFPLRDVLSLLSTVRNVFVHNPSDPRALIHELLGISRMARREGILALEGQINAANDDFFKRGIQLAIDGVPSDVTRDILNNELQIMQERHALGQAVLTAMAAFAPAFGMIGTLIGLVQMLATLEEPSQIGRGMAVALLTTLYGALIANLVLLPILGKLRVRTAHEVLHRELIIEGVLSIQAGEHPHILEQRLQAFLPPEFRKKATTSVRP